MSDTTESIVGFLVLQNIFERLQAAAVWFWEYTKCDV
jgi:hypothetical protein